MNNAEKQSHIIDNSDVMIEQYCEFADTLPEGSYIGSVYSDGDRFECVVYSSNNQMIGSFSISL